MKLRRRWMYFLALIFALCRVGDVLGHGLNQTAVALRISEVYYDTPGTDNEEEWIELANLGTSPVGLTDFKIGDEEAQGGGEGMMGFPAGSLVEGEEVIIVAQTAAAFERLFGFSPAFEMQDSQPNVPDMVAYGNWAEGDVGLANDGDEVLLLDGLDRIIDAVSFGDTGESVLGAFRPPTVPGIFRGQSIERVPAGCDTDTAVDWIGQSFPTPGRVTVEGECRTASNPDPELLVTIGEIQGQGERAAMLNQTVTFQGVVTGWIEDENSNGTRFYTLFVQDVPGTEDGDPLTSDGIAVFLSRQRPTVQRGDLVLVKGQVTEFFGLTEIDDNNLELSIIGRQQPLPEPVFLRPPMTDEPAYYEPLEGMLVSIETAVVVGPTYSTCGLAVTSAEAGILRQFRHQLSDPSGQVVTVLHTSDVDCGNFPAVQVGDQISGLSGPLHYHFEEYKIVNQVTAVLEFDKAGLPPLDSPLTAGAGQITIATLNLYEYFDTVDDTGNEAEPKLSAGELAIKQAKLIEGIGRALGCPTILGVQEVENESLLQTLAAGLVEACGFTYQVTHLESADSRGIDVAMLSDPQVVNVLSADLRQVCTAIETDVIDSSIDCPAGQSPLFSRPPLEVRTAVDGQAMTMFINHFKSKREGEAETAARRLAQAAHIRNLVEEVVGEESSTGNQTAKVIVLGDFNDFARSEVMDKMTADGVLVNVFMDGPAAIETEEQYTYIFGGLAQFIDNILVTPPLAELVVETMIVHSNTDFPYTLGGDTSIAGLPYFFSDHDVPILLMSLEKEEPPPTEEPTAAAPVVTASPSPVVVTPVSDSGVPDVDPEEKFEVNLVMLMLGAAVVSVILNILWRRVRGK